MTWAILLAVAVGCSKGEQKPVKETAELTPVPAMSAYALAEPIQTRNLSVVPVIYRNPVDKLEDYATLAEATKHGWIEIIEMPDGQVDTLRVRNTGPKPLLLLGGELLIGGKQDRVVCKDVIIPPGKTMEVAVNCVEHGRWQGSSNKFESAQMMVPFSVRKQAFYGSQEGVWDKVKEVNAKAGAAAGETTIQAGLAGKEVQARFDTDLEQIVSALRKSNNVVGMIIAIDGVPQTIELFGTPSLFAATQESLLKGALSEAALNGSGTNRVPSMADCTAFFSDCLNGKRLLKGRGVGVNTFSASSPDIDGAEIATTDYEAKPAQKQAGLVHGTYSRNQGK
jgi:hypothetical protein